MIETAKYYLGAITKDTIYYAKDTPKEAYKNERAISGCEGEVGPKENNSQIALEANNECRVWANNPATWNGIVALLYPSDYGYSAINQYWNTILGYNSFDGQASKSSWLGKALKTIEWFLSPSSNTNNGGMYLSSSGSLGDYGVSVGRGIRPCLYLKSDVKIISGDGSQNNQYKLSLD